MVSANAAAPASQTLLPIASTVGAVSAVRKFAVVQFDGVGGTPTALVTDAATRATVGRPTASTV